MDPCHSKGGHFMIADLKGLNPNKFHQDICGLNKKTNWS
jgi:hypothetical protein